MDGGFFLYADEAAAADGLLLAIRVELTGRSPASAEIRTNHDRLEAEIRNRAAELGDIWVEKIKVSTSPPIDLDALRVSELAIGGLLRRIDAYRSDPASLVATFAEDFEKLRAKLPAGVRTASGESGFEDEGSTLDPTTEAALLQALDGAEAQLVALLAEGSK